MNNRKNWLIALAVVLVGTGLLYFGVFRERPVAEPSISKSEAASLINDGEYAINGTTTAFHEGRAEALATLSKKLPAIKVVYDLTNVVGGDLDGTGGDDAAAILSMTSGSNWDTKSIAAFLDNGGKMEFVGSIFLGDRIAIQSLEIKERVITVNALVHGQNDFVNDPQSPRTFTFGVKNGTLTEIR